MKKTAILLVILSSCILNVRGQDSVSFTINNTDTIYHVLFDKIFELGKKCHPENDIPENDIENTHVGTIIDLIDTTNNNLGIKSLKVNILNNHIYHTYRINEECVSILMLIHDDKAYFFDEYETGSRYRMEDSTKWEYDSLNTPPPYYTKYYPKSEWTCSDCYVFKHPKKLNALLDFINRIGIKYTEEELLRIKHFNSNRWRLRTYK